MSVTEAQLHELLRFAILAPSPKNSQPWSFAVRENRVFLLADLGRSSPISDPDRRELYIGLGCALENLLVAAEHFGLAHSVSYFPERWHPELAAVIQFQTGGTLSAARAGTTLAAMHQRQNNTSLFHATEVPLEIRQRLADCCVEPDLLLNLSDDDRFHRWIVSLTVQADEIDLANPAFQLELEYWTRQEVFGADLGPSGSKDPDAVQTRKTALTVLNQLKVESSSLLGVIRGAGDSHLIHLRTGQLFERLWLTATVAGISINPMSQTMRRPELRSAVAGLTPSVGWIPQHLFRLGYSTSRPDRPSSRRPLSEVLL